MIGIFAAGIALGWGVYWYMQNQEIIQPNIATVMRRQHSVAATLAYQQDGVEVNQGDEGWQPVETDTVLHDGDGIRTSAARTSRAIILLENGTVIRLGYETEVFLTDLRSSNMIIMQSSGATYSRVHKGQGVYTLKTDDVAIKALGTAFDVVMDETTIDVSVLESRVAVRAGDSEQEVGQGDAATIDKESQDVSILKIDTEKLKNEWYTWNKEEDTKVTDDLGIMQEYAGPELTIQSPEDGYTTTEGTVTVTGTVADQSAILTVNGEAAENADGTFTKPILLSAGKNTITVVAEDANGNRRVQEVKVIYDIEVPLTTATPLVLYAETKQDGVHLQWNASTSQSFQYYKVVRSETNADLKFPADGYIAKTDAGSEAYTDTDVQAAISYYYRVCEVMEGNIVFCSNVAYMKGGITEDSPPAENGGTGSANTGSMTLSAIAESTGIRLSWTVSDLTIEHGFKLVRSEAANPAYPGSDFQYITDSTARSYTWLMTDGKTYHFRVCQYSGDGACISYSNDATATAPAVSADASLLMTLKAEDSGVGIWWTDASSITGFKYYKVVRSETNADLRYPDDGYIAVKSKGEESHRDYGAIKGTAYYYRICAVGDETICSNVARVTAINENEPPTAVSLSATYDDGTVELTWAASLERDFSYYKVVWSQTNASPKYPADGYLAPIGDASTTTYADTGNAAGSRTAAVNLESGTHYYSVCVVDSASQVTCSNTVTLKNGVIQ